jgi:2-oxoglutarate ferredoxin oxidoreductase subunit gamma
MEERIACAGFGGQGVMAIGQMLTYASMIENRNVSWYPSYGPEMRGGTATCSVVVSDSAVGSPVVADASAAIVMNRPSLDKYEPLMKKGGKLFVNSSLTDREVERTDIDVYKIPANELANELGSLRVANMVMLGAFLEVTKLNSEDSIKEAFKAVFGEHRMNLWDLNQKALQKGAEAAKKQM